MVARDYQRRTGRSRPPQPKEDRMQRKLKLLLPLMTAAALAFPSAAPAEERDCRGAIGAETVDNLRVPDSETCTLSGTHVKGTIKVETGATLRASTVAVVGNVQ